ncbi:cyclophilin-like fold protein [Belliella sp. DSM 107340]|uniref:Cyclophilin-like fold protein n=1 Tax=Belliella calami TaxID=2923436 RepID=A0ABS9UJL6_9BACT|nr:cyclophilin-like fold protein [Belliella calami]MCH7396777.1 cyclophilin-like fold protein [Belliella calami]
MKRSFSMMLVFVSFLVSGASSCNQDDDNINMENKTPMANGKIKITVNSQTFTATLLDNNSAMAFKEMLPMTVEMIELNRNEKYVRLPENLPTNASNPGTIHPGDLMLYGSNTVVLFYEGLNTSYSYTRMGKIDDPSGLRNALGTGNVTVTFEMDKNSALLGLNK